MFTAQKLKFHTVGFKIMPDELISSGTELVNTPSDVQLKQIIVMTSLKLKGTWNEAKGKLKQKYAQLTDDDLTFAEGKEDELLGRLQQRLGKNKEELRKEIEAM